MANWWQIACTQSKQGNKNDRSGSKSEGDQSKASTGNKPTNRGPKKEGQGGNKPRNRNLINERLFSTTQSYLQ